MSNQIESKRQGSGTWFNGLAGETLGARKLVYLDTNGAWKLANADSAASYPVVGITGGAITSGKRGMILLKGFIGDAGWSFSDLGAAVYATGVAGELSQTQPTDETKIQAVALAFEDDLLYFDTGLNRQIENFSISETNWDDLRFPASSVRLAGAAPATSQAYKDGVVLAFASTPNQFMYLIAQLPHSWAEGTDIVPHIHWTIPVNGGGVGAENVKWDLTYSWSDIGGAIPNSSSDTITRDVQNISADVHMLNNFAAITATGKDKSSVLIISVKRDTAVANDYANDAYMMEFDLHYKINRPGSTGIPVDTPA